MPTMRIIKIIAVRHSQSIVSQVILESVFVTINTEHHKHDYNNSAKAFGEKGALVSCKKHRP